MNSGKVFEKLDILQLVRELQLVFARFALIMAGLKGTE